MILAAPAPAGAAIVRARWIMGTILEITAHGPASAVSAAFAEVERLDRVLSLYKEDSELSALNRSTAAFRCSPDLWEAVAASLDYARRSGGAFDPTVLPPARRGKAALASVGHEKVRLDPALRTVRFTAPGMALDFGGIGKGLALDHAARVLKDAGVRAAFLNFGGQILALGAPPGTDGWSVEAPGGRTLTVKDASVSTSGDSERPGHILSPFTGEPVRRAGSVTVVAPTGAEADAWSTALFVLGPAARPGFPGRAYWDEPSPSISQNDNSKGVLP